MDSWMHRWVGEWTGLDRIGLDWIGLLHPSGGTKINKKSYLGDAVQRRAVVADSGDAARLQRRKPAGVAAPLPRIVHEGHGAAALGGVRGCLCMLTAVSVSPAIN